MKLIIIILSLSLPAFCFGQFEEEYVEERQYNIEKPGPKFVLKTNPLAILSGEIPIVTSEYRILLEYVPDYKQSYTGGVSLFTMSPILRSVINSDSSLKNIGLNSTDFSLLGYRIQGGYRLYPLGLINKSATEGTFPPKGLYLFGLISYSDARFFQNGNSSTQIQFSHASATLNIGYQFIIDADFSLDLYFGSGYKNNQILEVSRSGRNVISQDLIGDTFIYNSNIKINFGINFGIVF